MRHALLLVLALAGSACSQPEPVTHEATGLLEFEAGAEWSVCSGTLIGANKVITATHCFEDGVPLVRFKGQPVKVLKRVDDGRDHTIITLDATFKAWATFGAPPVQSQRVRMWGNPLGQRDLYREGYVSGRWEGGMQTVALEVHRGDSGAGLFDDSGKLVGVVSTLIAPEIHFSMAGTLPLGFKAADL